MKKVYVELDDCYPLLTEHAQSRWDDIKEHGKLQDFFDLVDELFADNVRLTEIDDYLKYEYENIAENLGFESYSEEKLEESYIAKLNKQINAYLNEDNKYESLPKDVHYEFTINKVADDKLELTSGESTFTIYIEPDDDLQDIQYAIEDFVDTELTYDEDDSENITGTEVVGFKYDQNTGKGKFEANIFFKED